MKTALQSIALCIVYPLFIILGATFFFLNALAGVSFGIFVILCGVMAARRKPKFLPFSSPGFLAVLGVTLVLVAPALHGDDVLAVGVALLLFSISLCLWIFTRISERKMKNHDAGSTEAADEIHSTESDEP